MRQLHAAVMTSLAAAVAVKRNRQTILLIFLSPFRLTFDLHQKIPKYIIYKKNKTKQRVINIIQ